MLTRLSISVTNYLHLSAVLLLEMVILKLGQSQCSHEFISILYFFSG